MIEELSRAKAKCAPFNTNEHNITTIEFFIPTRGLMGYRNNFLTVTRGLGILTSVFDSYGPLKEKFQDARTALLISNGPWQSHRLMPALAFRPGRSFRRSRR